MYIFKPHAKEKFNILNVFCNCLNKVCQGQEHVSRLDIKEDKLKKLDKFNKLFLS